MATIAENLKEKYISSFKLGDDNMFKIVKIDKTKVKGDVKSVLVSYFNEIQKIINHSTKVEGKVKSISNEEKWVIGSLRRNILNLLFKEDKKYLYIPLFLLYYAYPGMENEIAKFKDCISDDDILSLLDGENYFPISELSDSEKNDNILSVNDRFRLIDVTNERFWWGADYANDEFWNAAFKNGMTIAGPNGHSEIHENILQMAEKISSNSKVQDSSLKSTLKELRDYLFPNNDVAHYEFSLIDDRADKFSRPFIKRSGKFLFCPYTKDGRLAVTKATSLITVVKTTRKVLSDITLLSTSGDDDTAIIFVPKNIEVITGGLCSSGRLLGVFFEAGSELKYIKGGAFCNTDHLSCFNLPKKVEIIGNGAFYSSSFNGLMLDKFVFGGNESLRKIGAFAFYTSDSFISPYEQTDLFTIHRFYTPLPPSLEEIGDFAFATGEDVYFNGTDFYEERISRDCYTKEELLKHYFQENDRGDRFQELRRSNIPDMRKCKKLRRIGVGAFRRCNLDDCFDGVLTIPASVEVIEDYAFSLCTNITKVVFESGSKLKYLGEKAFFGILHLEEVEFDSECPLERIKYMTFAFTAVKSIAIPYNVTVIENCAFLLSTRDWYGDTNTIRWRSGKNFKRMNNFFVKEKFYCRGVHLVETEAEKRGKGIEYLTGITEEEFKSRIYQPYNPTPYAVRYIGNLDDSTTYFMEDDMILEYLKTLNSDKILTTSNRADLRTVPMENEYLQYSYVKKFK
jgi:hypothetical protein